jgi:translocation and assembly module TamA
MRKNSGLFVLLLALTSPAATGQVSINAPAGLAGKITPYLRDNNSAQGSKKLAGEILATEGYFSPSYELLEANGEAGRGSLKIDPGPRTLIDRVDLAVDGPIDPKSRQALIDDWRLPVGQPFRQADWNSAKQQLLGELLAVEYASARLLDSQAEIDLEKHQAALSAHYDSGPRYRFGPLQIDGLARYSPELIARYNHSVLPGEPYQAESLTRLVSNLQASPYFASVQAELDLASAQVADDGTAVAPVHLRVRERPAHRAAFGAGFSSNTGARVEANYKTPDLFGQAWALDSGLRLEQKRQTLYGDVFLPPDARQRRHSIGAMSESSDIEKLKIDRYALGVQSVQQRGSVEQRLSLNWQHERRTPEGAEAVTSRALVPNITWTWRQVDHVLDPRAGHILQLSLGGGAKAALSDQNFLRLHGRWQHYLPLGQRDTLALRAELGRTVADSRLRIPQDYLFRTGGTGSVRGYGYQSLGIKEGEATVGGRYLAVGSVEYTHWLDNDWGIAAFVDAGDAVDALREAKLAVGYGLGVRWRSPAGPIAADLAYGERERRVQLHFSLAIPF